MAVMEEVVKGAGVRFSWLLFCRLHTARGQLKQLESSLAQKLALVKHRGSTRPCYRPDRAAQR